MELITIGKILKPQGVKGELKVKPMLENIQLLQELNECYVGKENKKHDVVKCDVRFGYAYITFSDIVDRNQAEYFRNLEIKTTREKIGDLGKDKYFIDDLVGMIVIDNENEQKIGILVDIEQYGAADVLIIYSEGRKWQVPFISELISNVDATNKKIYINYEKFKEMRICE